MDAIVLSEVALELAEYKPDVNTNIPRAEWRWGVIEKAIEIVRECNITRASEDIDEIVQNYLSNEEALS